MPSRCQEARLVILTLHRGTEPIPGTEPAGTRTAHQAHRSPPARGMPPDGLFARQVRDALRHLYDPVYLQTHPLARWVWSQDACDAAGRGRRSARQTAGAALQRALEDVVAALQPHP